VADQATRAHFEEFGFGLLLQRAARHDPAKAIRDRANEVVRGDERQQTFAAAGRDAADNGARVLAALTVTVADFLTDLVEAMLMAAEHESVEECGVCRAEQYSRACKAQYNGFAPLEKRARFLWHNVRLK